MQATARPSVLPENGAVGRRDADEAGAVQQQHLRYSADGQQLREA